MTTATESTTATGTLHMVRARVDAREFRRWMGERRLRDPDHAIHCLLTECFGSPPTGEHPDNSGLAPKPFRLILPRDGSDGCLYGYVRSDADAMRDMAAACADPLQCRILPLDELHSKPMPETWQAGKRLGFEVRVRPVARRSRNADERPEKECDAYLWEALKYPKGEMDRGREQVYAEWLSRQMESRGGACLDVERTKLVSFQRVRAYRKARPDRYSEGPDAVMRGELTITDSDAFARLLAGGVGRHRAYGYGMLLLRPAGRAG